MEQPYGNDNLSDSGHSDQHPSGQPSVMMDTGVDGDAYGQGYENAPLRTIPVDFTEAFRQRDVGNESKKRTFTARGNGEDTDHYRGREAEDENIDPSLPHRGSGASDSKGSRRAELQREAENMRRRLLAAERELAELGEER